MGNETSSPDTYPGLREALTRGARYLELVADFLPIMVAVTDGRGRGVFFNRHMQERFGRSPDELRDLGWLEVVHPEDRERARGAWLDALEQGRRSRVPLRAWSARDGEFCWNLLEAVPLREPGGGSEGGVLRWLVVFMDIHEQKLAEERAATQARQSAALAELGRMALERPERARLAERACRLVADTLGVELCGVLRLVPDGERLVLEAGVGWEGGADGAAAARSGSAAGLALERGAPVRVEREDLAEGARFAGEALLRGHGVASGACVPIGTPEGAYGVLGAHARSRRAFTDSDVNFLRGVANILAEEVHRERGEARLEALFETSQQMLVLLDASGRVLMANPAAFAFVRLVTGDELRVGAPFEEYVLPHNQASFQDHVYRALQGEVVRIERSAPTRDGRRLGFDFTYAPIRLGGGVAGVVMSAVDVTAHQEAQRALAKSERRYRGIFDTAAVGVAQVALDGTILDANERYCRNLGYARREISDGRMRVQRLTHPDDVTVGEERMDALLRGEIPSFEMDKRYVCKDGGVMWGRLSASLARDEGGAPLYFIAVVEDVTARREAEEALRFLTQTLEQRVETRTRQLRAINHELETFAYTVSHDLRAPLRGIDGFSRVLEEDYADALDATARGYLRRIRAGAGRMGELIDDLLMLSRVGQADLVKRDVDLSALAAEIVAALRDAEPGREVRVSVEEGLVAWGDPRLLRAALENLLGNAWKYTRNAPDPRIAFARGGEGGAEGAETVFRVSDNGAGFDPRHAERLFVPFGRLHASSEFEGTGVGLATVQRIVHRHGGRVWAEGRPGGGAAFHVALPRRARGGGAG